MSDIKSVDFLSAQVSGYAIDNASHVVGVDLITTIQNGNITQGSVRIVSEALYGNNFIYGQSKYLKIVPTEDGTLRLSSLVKDSNNVITVVFKKPIVEVSGSISEANEQLTLSFMEQDSKAYSSILGSNTTISYTLE